MELWHNNLGLDNYGKFDNKGTIGVSYVLGIPIQSSKALTLQP